MKNVLITGATRGIGRACAEEFLNNGYRVFANYNKSKEEAKELFNKGCIIYKADVSEIFEVSEMVDDINKNYGGIDVLINNAGIALSQKVLTDVTDEEYDRVFNINVKGMFNVTKKVLPSMINKKSGNIINISSIWGITGGSCEVIYSASKAAIIGFTKALAKEVGLSGIRVNAVAPGVIDTDMNKHLSDEDFSCLIDETPLQKIGKSSDISKLVLFLAEKNSSFITGEVINISGGLVI